MELLLHSLADQIESIQTMLLILNAILHLIFAGAVAKDAGKLVDIGRETILVSGFTWAFATLVGGIFVAVAYWFLHHFPIITREQSRTKMYQAGKVSENGNL
jgi:hypothetical protein